MPTMDTLREFAEQMRRKNGDVWVCIGVDGDNRIDWIDVFETYEEAREFKKYAQQTMGWFGWTVISSRVTSVEKAKQEMFNLRNPNI